MSVTKNVRGGFTTKVARGLRGEAGENVLIRNLEMAAL